VGRRQQRRIEKLTHFSEHLIPRLRLFKERAILSAHIATKPVNLILIRNHYAQGFASGKSING
jgi:hypothetical protein